MPRADLGYAGQSLIVPASDPESDIQDSTPIWVMPGASRLELAAANGHSPWDRPTSEAYWIIPGTLLFEPGSSSMAYPVMLKSLALNSVPLIQGQTAVVTAITTSGFELKGELGEQLLSFFPDEEGQQIALQGIHALQEPGLLDLSVTLTHAEDPSTQFTYHQGILVAEGAYGFQVLNGVPPETVDPAVIGPEENLIREILAERSDTRYWEGPFEFPSRYYTEEFISVFGTRRNYNNGALLHYHTGVDFYGQNVPIYAPADGVIVFADELAIRGNATYIDHGWGVYSGYLHQSEIYVEVGERVSKGQVIGQVGATGRVTGPHLHWEIWVGGVPVEPLDWVEASIP
jgi:murein DD-endopeptidase MepM/ murein hydrolase activator NlpD